MASFRKPWQVILLRLVKERPCLYDKNDRDYHDKEAKAMKWWEITQGIIDGGYPKINRQIVDVPFVRKKWKSMRDLFVRHMRLYDEKCASRGIDQTAEPNVFYFREFKFLLDELEISKPAKEAFMRLPDLDDYSKYLDTDDVLDECSLEDDLSRLSDLPTPMLLEPSPPDINLPPIQSALTTTINPIEQLRPPTKFMLPMKRPYNNHPKPFFSQSNSKPSDVGPKINGIADVFNYDDDRNFGQLVEHRLREIPHGQSKELLKIEILRMIYSTKYPLDKKPIDTCIELSAPV